MIVQDTLNNGVRSPAKRIKERWLAHLLRPAATEAPLAVHEEDVVGRVADVAVVHAAQAEVVIARRTDVTRLLPPRSHRARLLMRPPLLRLLRLMGQRRTIGRRQMVLLTQLPLPDGAMLVILLRLLNLRLRHQTKTKRM